MKYAHLFTSLQEVPGLNLGWAIGCPNSSHDFLPSLPANATDHACFSVRRDCLLPKPYPFSISDHFKQSHTRGMRFVSNVKRYIKACCD